MRTIKVDGTDALATMDRLRKLFPQTGEFPFIIGDDRDLQGFNDLCSAPTDDGREILAAAESFDAAAWLAEQAPSDGRSWPKRGVPAQTTVTTLYDVLSRKLKPSVHVGLVAAAQPWEIFAKLGYGGWNDCPDPHIHVALHRYWHQRYKSSPIVVSGDVVECLLTQPPSDRASALALAREQFSYCYDIVEQGVGSIGKLASSLLDSKFWYFWWD